MFDGYKCKFCEDYKIISEFTAIYMIMFPFRDSTDYKYILCGPRKVSSYKNSGIHSSYIPNYARERTNA